MEIKGRPINQLAERYCISIPSSEASMFSGLPFEGNVPKRKMTKTEDGSYEVTVSSVSSKFVADETVYNFSTTEHTYLAQNIAVHNCGLDVAEDGKGRSRRKDHLIEVEYTDRDGNPAKKMSITFNPFLKTKLVGVLGSSFLRSKGPYADVYNGYKFRLENHPNHKDKTKLHRHNMAVRYAVKIFLQELWLKWRELEGLEVTAPYAEAKLGMVHGM